MARPARHQPWTTDLQPLPIARPPLKDELACSYVNRLAAANGGNLLALLHTLGNTASTVRSYATRPDEWASTGELILNRPAFDRLALATGYPASLLRQTLAPTPGYRRRAPDDLVPTLRWGIFHHHPSKTARSRPALACPRCAAERDPTATIRVRAPIERPGCLRHRYWIIDDFDGPLDISDHDDLLAAIRTYRKLRRRHSDEQLLSAFETARRICYQYRDRIIKPEFLDGIQHRWNERRQRLGAGKDWLVVRYPEIVTVTSVICSDYWLTAAARPYRRPPLRKPRPDGRDFLFEVGRRLGHPDPAKLVKSSDSIGQFARTLQPTTKLRWGYYPEKGQIR